MRTLGKAFFRVLVIVNFIFCVALSVEAYRWIQTDWSGGSGQFYWSDTTKYYKSDNVKVSLLLKLTLGGYGEWNNTATFTNTNKVYGLAQYLSGAIYASTGDIFAKTFKSVNQGNTWDTLFYYTDCRITRANQLVEGDLYITIDHTDNTTYIVKYTGDTLPATYNRFLDSQFAYDLLNAFDRFFFLCGDDTARVYKGTFDGSWTPHILPGKRALCIIKSSNGILYVGTGGIIGKVMKSTNQGDTWEPTDTLPATTSVNTLVEAPDGTIYAGTSPNGRVFKTTDAGLTWEITGELTGADKIFSLICDTLGNLYAGVQDTAGKGAIFKSRNNGIIWTNYGELEGTNAVRSLLKLSDTTLLAGTGDSLGMILKGFDAYDTLGYLVSSVYNIGVSNGSVRYDTISWDADYNGQEITVKVRSFQDTITWGDTIPWAICPPCTNGQSLASITSVRDSMQFVQYMVEFRTQMPFLSPVLREIKINYSVDTTSPLIDSAIAYGMLPNDKVMIYFNEPMTPFAINSSNIDSLFRLSNNHTWLDGSGQVSTVWDASCEILTIYLGSNPNPNWVNRGDTIFIQTFQNDSITDKWKNLCTSHCVIGGTFAPYIDSVLASDGICLKEYVDNDDYIILYFSKNTNKPVINASNINNVLKVRGRTWLNGKNEIRSCVWNPSGSALTCSLKVDSLRPTLQIGDTIFPDSITIQDAELRGKVISPSIIRGTFGEYGPVMDSAIAGEGLPQEVDIGAGDYVLIYFNKLIEALPESLNLDTVLIPQKNGVQHSWYHNNSGDSLECMLQQLTLADIQGFPYTLLYLSFDFIGIEEKEVSISDYSVKSYPNPIFKESYIEYRIVGTNSIRAKEKSKTKANNGLVVGDTIYPNPNLIKDAKGHQATKCVVLRGSFDTKGKGIKFSSLLNTAGQGNEANRPVSLKIYNLGGQLVKTLVDELQFPGAYKIAWDRRDNNGKLAKSGIYFYKLNVKELSGARGATSEPVSFTGKLILL